MYKSSRIQKWQKLSESDSDRANSQEAEGDAPTGWQSPSEFTLTLQSGQTVEVTFLPCLVGLSRMHEFSFTGPVSSTGFKSHFVLAVENETRYYISSLSATAREFGERIRGYWGVENKVHYVRDVTQGEDGSRIRTTPLPQIFGLFST